MFHIIVYSYVQLLVSLFIGNICITKCTFKIFTCILKYICVRICANRIQCLDCIHCVLWDAKVFQYGDHLTFCMCEKQLCHRNHYSLFQHMPPHIWSESLSVQFNTHIEHVIKHTHTHAHMHTVLFIMVSHHENLVNNLMSSWLFEATCVISKHLNQSANITFICSRVGRSRLVNV